MALHCWKCGFKTGNNVVNRQSVLNIKCRRCGNQGMATLSREDWDALDTKNHQDQLKQEEINNGLAVKTNDTNNPVQPNS